MNSENSEPAREKNEGDFHRFLEYAASVDHGAGESREGSREGSRESNRAARIKNALTDS